MKKSLFVLWCLCSLFVECENDEKGAEMPGCLFIFCPMFYYTMGSENRVTNS